MIALAVMSEPGQARHKWRRPLCLGPGPFEVVQSSIIMISRASAEWAQLVPKSKTKLARLKNGTQWRQLCPTSCATQVILCVQSESICWSQRYLSSRLSRQMDSLTGQPCKPSWPKQRPGHARGIKSSRSLGKFLCQNHLAKITRFGVIGLLLLLL